MTNEFLLEDRLTKIQSVINKYGEDNFYISFSGGKDSCVLSTLIDMSLPENKIPRVFANTGIEYNMIVDFVKSRQQLDDRIIILTPSKNIKSTLETVGYPFKSKFHSYYLNYYMKEKETGKFISCWRDYAFRLSNWHERLCPKKLQYQFSDDWKERFKISDLCCAELKEKPLKEYQKQSGKKYKIVGLMRDEGGRREKAVCLAFQGDKLKSFQPLVPVTKEWEEWFINTFNVAICDIYKPPYNFKRTGCKGCPFSRDIQAQLDIMQEYFPEEKRQCELIWKPVYTEYRRIGYRLRKDDGL